MEIRLNKTELITNAEVKEFSIADDGISKAVIMSILTTSKYTDPVGAAIRESIANALDAHREAGCPGRPIEITLPTAHERILKIRDYGTGMSREVIDNVYTNLGVSTKRSSNDLQGGFGIGAAAVLAPSSQAQLTTIYEGTKYTYILFRNEQKIPAIALTGTTDAGAEEPGTEVALPLNTEITTIQQKLLDICLYLEPSPVFVNDEWLQRELANKKANVKPQYTNTTWVEVPGEDRTIPVQWGYTSTNPSEATTLKVLNDFVCYEWGNLVTGGDSLEFYRGNSNTLTLKFPVGELDLPSDRERLQVTDRNSQLISIAASKASAELRQIVTETIGRQEDFIEAYKLAYKSPWETFTWNETVYSTTPASHWSLEKTKYVGFDMYEGWKFRAGIGIHGTNEFNRVKRVLETKVNTSVLPFKCYVNARYLLDYPIYLIQTGMVTNTFLKRAGLTQADSFIFLQLDNPEEWLEAHPIYKLLGAKVVLAPEQKKERKEETDPRKVFKSLARGEGAVRKLHRFSEYSPVWDCISNVNEIPESGFYLESDFAKSVQARRIALLKGNFNELYIFQPRLAQVVQQINFEAEGSKPWINAIDEVKRRTLAFAESYKDVFVRLNTDLRSSVFDPSSIYYTKLKLSLEIPSVAGILDPDGRLRELLSEPNLKDYYLSWDDNYLQLDWCRRSDEEHNSTKFAQVEDILEPIYLKYPLLRWSGESLLSDENYNAAARHYIELINQEQNNV